MNGPPPSLRQCSMASGTQTTAGAAISMPPSQVKLLEELDGGRSCLVKSAPLPPLPPITPTCVGVSAGLTASAVGEAGTTVKAMAVMLAAATANSRFNVSLRIFASLSVMGFGRIATTPFPLPPCAAPERASRDLQGQLGSPVRTGVSIRETPGLEHPNAMRQSTRLPPPDAANANRAQEWRLPQIDEVEQLSKALQVVPGTCGLSASALVS
jgi:hypothetical protein